MFARIYAKFTLIVFFFLEFQKRKKGMLIRNVDFNNLKVRS